MRTCATRYCTLVQCQVYLCSTLAPSRRRHFWHFVQHACLTACGTCNVDTIHLIGIALLCGTHLQGVAYCLQGEPQSAVQELALTLYLRSSKFPPNPLMPEIKWRRPGENQYRCVLRFIVLFYSRIGSIKDFLRYANDSGGFLVALAIRRCVNATAATMETARSVEEGWREVKASVGC